MPLESFGNWKDGKDGKRAYCRECDHKRDRANYERKKAAVKVCVDSKICPGCKLTKVRDRFNKQTENKDGLSTYCKDCVSKRNKASRSKAIPHEVSVPRKTCPKCELDKMGEEFYKDPDRKDGLSRRCRECEKAGANERSMKIKEGPKKVVLEKKCVRCQTVFPASNFSKDSYASDGLNCYCQNCSSIVNKENRPRLFRKEPRVDRKVCPACKVEKGVEEFYCDAVRSDGLSWECRECTKAYVKKWAEDNPERKRENDVYGMRLKLMDGRDAQHKIEFKETHPDYQKEWRNDNKEHMQNYMRKYQRELYEMERTKILEYKRVWNMNNPDKGRIQRHRRRSRLNNLPFDVTEQDIGDIFEMFGECCAFCGSEEELELDHVIPISWDDPANPGTVRGNLMPLCKSCNPSKSDTFLEDYLADENLWVVRFLKSLQERGISAKDLETEIKFLLHMSKKINTGASL